MTQVIAWEEGQGSNADMNEKSELKVKKALSEVIKINKPKARYLI